MEAEGSQPFLLFEASGIEKQSKAKPTRNTMEHLNVYIEQLELYGEDFLWSLLSVPLTWSAGVTMQTKHQVSLGGSP